MILPTIRAPVAWIFSLWFVLSSAAAASFALFPALILLLHPHASARRLFVYWAGVVQRTGLSMGLFFTRVFLGIEIVLHGRFDLASLRKFSLEHGNVLVVANHRTPLDWLFVWGPMAAMGRLRSQRFVTLHWARFAPGVGWCAQCCSFGFVRRGGDTSGDLARMRHVVLGDHPGVPLTPCIFPEGRDLRAPNIAESNRFADAQDPPLPHYTHVLHPRTSGFCEMCRALAESAAEHPSTILDMTIGYETFIPGETPTPISVLLLGRIPPKVHILVDVVKQPSATGAAELCRSLFALKEKRLTDFYESHESTNVAAFEIDGQGSGGWGLGACCWLSDSSLVGMMVHLGLQVGIGLIWFHLGVSVLLVYFCATAFVFTSVSCFGGVDGMLILHSKTCPSAAAQTSISGGIELETYKSI